MIIGFVGVWFFSYFFLTTIPESLDFYIIFLARSTQTNVQIINQALIHEALSNWTWCPPIIYTSCSSKYFCVKMIVDMNLAWRSLVSIRNLFQLSQGRDKHLSGSIYSSEGRRETPLRIAWGNFLNVCMPEVPHSSPFIYILCRALLCFLFSAFVF